MVSLIPQTEFTQMAILSKSRVFCSSSHFALPTTVLKLDHQRTVRIVKDTLLKWDSTYTHSHTVDLYTTQSSVARIEHSVYTNTATAAEGWQIRFCAVYFIYMRLMVRKMLLSVKRNQNRNVCSLSYSSLPYRLFPMQLAVYTPCYSLILSFYRISH